MSDYETTYQVMTPSGVFNAVWGEEPEPIEYRGNEAAILHFKNFLALDHVSGFHGILLNPDNLQPDELYLFCQPTGSGITVIPPLDDLLAYERDELNQQSGEPALDNVKDTGTMQEEMILDATFNPQKDKWVSTKTGSHLIVRGDKVIAGAGGALTKKSAIRKKIDQASKLIRLGHIKASEMKKRTLSLIGKMLDSASLNDEDLLDIEAIFNDFEMTLDSTALDSVSGIQKLKLVKELGGIRGDMAGSVSGIAKLKLVKRLAEIRVLLGGAVNDIADLPIIPVPELPQGLGHNIKDVTTDMDERYDEEDYFEQQQDAFSSFKELNHFQIQDDVDEGIEHDFDYDSDTDPLQEFAWTAFIVHNEVEAYGGNVAWGDFDASAYTGELFDSVAYGDDFIYDSVVVPGGIVGQIADKLGMIVARVRIEENGMLTLLSGANGTEQAASPTAVVSKIHAAVAVVFGGVDNRVKEANLGLEAGAGSAENDDESKPFDDYVSESGGDLSIAAKSYFKAELQGKIVKTIIGDVHVIGGTWQEMKRNINKDMIKAQLISHIVDILKNGQYLGKEGLNKERADNFIAFHFFEMDGLKIGDYLVDAGVTVAQRKEGQLEFDLSAYGLGHSQEARWKKRKGEVVVSGQKPEITSPQEPEKPVLDSSVGSNTGGVNIIILRVTDLEGNEITELEDDLPAIPEVTLPDPVPDPAPTITGNTEIDRQKSKLLGLQNLQERMKAANKITGNKKLSEAQKTEQLKALGESEANIRRVMNPDYMGNIGYPKYALTNNNAVINNTKKRIAQMEAQDLAAAKASSGDSETSFDFEGGTIELDYSADRLKVDFDVKPGSEMTSKLKQNGFKYSYTNEVWQRQLTDNAISTANYLFGTKIKTAATMMNEEENKPRPNPIVPAVEVGELVDPIKAAFKVELKELESATDIHTLDKQLDDVMERIEEAGLSEALDKPLNDAVDRMTYLLAEAEKKAA